jgi:hypothetical protein
MWGLIKRCFGSNPPKNNRSKTNVSFDDTVAILKRLQQDGEPGDPTKEYAPSVQNLEEHRRHQELCHIDCETELDRLNY